ncbi:hypothetical protein GCM10011386_35550 [Parapedobacter defluvii]|uniref:IrrE N-terminal-like domain-containing protein n=1 Tax=Parapedobacter defluvii TaxID=2045106 RepID=A0ABQ1MNT1_9SPHI|nr:hypothetical protein [Parapedobacter defluvii]GGC40387.1 hypothetical protein GCM10011386_35550 [Parapedobacter defluvii]
MVFHEYAHIIDGHIDYYTNKGICKLFEVQPEYHVPSYDPIFRQTIELLADDFAIFGCIRFLHHIQLGTFPVNPLLKSYFNDWKSALQFWYLPIYTFFRLFGHCNQPYLVKTAYHPIPAMRSYLVLESIDYFLDSDFNIPEHEEISMSCIASMFKIEDAFDKVSEQGRDLKPLKYSLTDEAISYAKTLIDKRNDVGSLLKKYSPVN